MTIDRKSGLAALVLAPLALGACAPVDHAFGESVAYAKSAHTVNPDPVYTEADAAPGAGGDVAAAAAERYRTGSVEQPNTVRSTQVRGGGG